MNRVDLLKHYQAYDPLSGMLGQPRTNREYAALLGIHESYLSKAYDGLHPVGIKALEGLRRAFPQEASRITELYFAAGDDIPQRQPAAPVASK